MDSAPLRGKCAIVTGGSRGIGQAIAVELAKRGAFVLITYASSASAANETVSTIAGFGGRASAICADSSQAEISATSIVREAVAIFDGKIDILVNNAGDATFVDMENLDTALFDRLMHVNVLFPLLLVKASRPYLSKGVRVVNLSSISARSAVPYSYVYGASKAALESVTRSLAAELGRSLDGTANAVNPGPVSTEMWNNLGFEDLAATEEAIKQTTLAGHRIGRVDDIAPIVAFLCDPSSKWITGNVTCANGGAMLF